MKREKDFRSILRTSQLYELEKQIRGQAQGHQRSKSMKQQEGPLIGAISPEKLRRHTSKATPETSAKKRYAHGSIDKKKRPSS
mmetsp:Transcript_41178/g.62634  ORF Transcript_41178/g.62634 Transcript_41178/m.62634 type:complete len:83 (+) Transcript_41178:463-711(+)